MEVEFSQSVQSGHTNVNIGIHLREVIPQRLKNYIQNLDSPLHKEMLAILEKKI